MKLLIIQGLRFEGKSLRTANDRMILPLRAFFKYIRRSSIHNHQIKFLQINHGRLFLCNMQLAQPTFFPLLLYLHKLCIYSTKQRFNFILAENQVNILLFMLERGIKIKSKSRSSADSSE